MASTCPLPAATTMPALRAEGRLNEAVNMLHSIPGIVASSTFVCLLRCCIRKKALEEGRRIHALMVNRDQLGFREDVFLHNSLLQMYVICDSLVDARGVFDGMIERNVFSWNFMITAYRKQGFCEEVLALFHEMQRNGSGVQPNEFIFSSVLPASASLEEGVDIHRKIIRSGFHSNVVVGTALIDMHAKFGNIQKARVLFDKMKDRNTISWNAMITGYAQNGLHKEALEVFGGMQRNDVVVPSEFTFASILPVCAISASMEEGDDIHRKIIRSGFHSNIVVMNALIDMYAKFGNIQKARVLFDKMQQRNAVSWTAMITGFAQNGLHEEALEVFEVMQRNDVVPNDEFTFASVLPACAISAAVEEGVDIHRKIIRSGFHSDVVVTTALIDMYAKFGNIQKACVLFDKMKNKNTVSWNAMITGYAQNGLHEEALEVFEEMQRNDIVPNDEVTFGSVLPASASSGSLEEGIHIHRKIIRSGFHPYVVVTTALIDMYAKLGKIQKARVLFDKMQQRNAVSWTAMITGFAQNGLHEKALEVFEGMQRNDVVPNDVTFVSVLPAYASSASLEEGVDIHRKIIRSGFHLNVIVTNALIDMYAKFGMIQKAHVLNDKMEQRDTILWNSMTKSHGIQ